MFLEERYENIINKINEIGRVAVKDLSKEFSVSEDCIRKDLKELEKREELKRVYGGAISVRKHIEIKPINERKSINIEKKRSIAYKALNLIEENDIIFLDVSTINLELAKMLKKEEKNITVFSNMIQIILELSECKNINLICSGGEFNKNVGAFVGTTTNEYIEKFTYDKSFIGVCAVNRETGFISNTHLEEGNTKKTIIENSKKSYIVMEKEKFNYDEFYKFAKIDDIIAIITEDEIIK
jgi:DeoR family transcriptional regulator, fructose operon transcriptional repressor